MKKKTIVISIFFLIFLLLVVFINKIGLATIPWKTVDYSSVKNPSSNYLLRISENPEAYWNEVFLTVVTSGENDTFVHRSYPFRINFILRTLARNVETSYTINSIEIKDRKENVVELKTSKTFPIVIELEDRYPYDSEKGLYFFCGEFSTDYAYYFKGKSKEVYYVFVELRNNDTGEMKDFNLELKPFVKRGFGYWWKSR